MVHFHIYVDSVQLSSNSSDALGSRREIRYRLSLSEIRRLTGGQHLMGSTLSEEVGKHLKWVLVNLRQYNQPM